MSDKLIIESFSMISFEIFMELDINFEESGGLISYVSMEAIVVSNWFIELEEVELYWGMITIFHIWEFSFLYDYTSNLKMQNY